MDKHISYAKIEIDTSGTPMATAYDDVYFSRAGGLSETNYVFLHGNNLPEAWQKKEHFTIIETGFGTGLNFLATVLLWQKYAKKNQKLLFISTEKHPIKEDDLKVILEDISETKHILAPYLQAYPLLTQGKRIEVYPNIFLEILIGDIKETLPHCTECADAWFLDGFSPAKNPEMWSDALFSAMEACSKKGTTVATFTAARLVKDGLLSAGFEIQKTKGFGFKRHRIIAIF